MKPPDAGPSNRLGPAPGPTGSRRSTAKGDVPEAVLDRYLVERDLRGRPERFFRDHRAAEPMFRDRGGSLVSSQAYPDAVVDMLKIARHRGWDRIQVSGDPAFRREVWIQAQALGLDVQGHRPRERDRQAAGLDRPSPRRDAETAKAHDALAERLAKAAIVVARLVPDAAIQTRLIEAAWARADRPRPTEREPARERDRQR
ncbi:MULTISPECIES: LPD7 domain-containing protein [unclassified Brevundimonas]|uniref:LPD7 domain-containing protein n=1 Tax=unclassified Brevundimonas TaxID=2622653 RepID=UPI0025BFBB2B|nr:MULTISPECIES: LPD7 domain-containing protein [unclassified Brevundimonas]